MSNRNGKQGAQATSDAPATQTRNNKAPAGKPASRDPRGIEYYAIDKTLDTFKGGLRQMEAQKTGTCRKLAGVSATGIGLTTAGIGIYLLVT